MDEESAAAILVLIGITVIIMFIILGILTIVWVINILEAMLGIKIPWYVCLFVCLTFVVSIIRVTIELLGD